jgi:DNA-binding beta-propeller fold protein YncE
MKRHLLVVLAISSLLTGSTVADTLLVANKTDGTVDLVETASGESRATLPTGAGPHEVAVSADGGTAVTTEGSARLLVVNVQDGTIVAASSTSSP